MSHPTANPPAGDPFANPSPSQDKPPALPDLPPVEAPSAGFVVQLFVIPAAVVVVVIIVWLLFGKLAGGERDAMEYVRQLRLPEANWRSAFELASLIQNDPAIASDPKLLGELTDLLSHELDRLEDPKHQEDPTLAQYLALTLGAFRTLEAQTQSGQVVDPLVPLARALGPKFDQSDPDRGGGQPGQAGGPARRQARRPPRRQGPRRDGRGRRTRRSARSPSTPWASSAAPQSDQVLRDRIRSDEDRFTRYNAAVALGRRGDPAAESTLREMLSTADLDKVVQVDPTPRSRTPRPPARTASRPSSSKPSRPCATRIRRPRPQLATVAPPRGREAHHVGARQRPQPGRRAVARAGPGEVRVRGEPRVDRGAIGWNPPCK